MSTKELREFCQIGQEGEDLLKTGRTTVFIEHQGLYPDLEVGVDDPRDLEVSLKLRLVIWRRPFSIAVWIGKGLMIKEILSLLSS